MMNLVKKILLVTLITTHYSVIAQQNEQCANTIERVGLPNLADHIEDYVDFQNSWLCDGNACSKQDFIIGNRLIDEIEKCDYNSADANALTDLTDKMFGLLSNTSKNEVSIKDGINYHMPRVVIECLSKIYKDSGDCNVSENLIKFSYDKTIHEQLDRSGVGLHILKPVLGIKCQDQKVTKLFLERVNGQLGRDIYDINDFDVMSEYFSKLETTPTISNTEREKICNRPEFKDGNFSFVRVVESLNISCD